MEIPATLLARPHPGCVWCSRGRWETCGVALAQHPLSWLLRSCRSRLETCQSCMQWNNVHVGKQVGGTDWLGANMEPPSGEEGGTHGECPCRGRSCAGHSTGPPAHLLEHSCGFLLHSALCPQSVLRKPGGTSHTLGMSPIDPLAQVRNGARQSLSPWGSSWFCISRSPLANPKEKEWKERGKTCSQRSPRFAHTALEDLACLLCRPFCVWA